jgi:hypothetical protein
VVHTEIDLVRDGKLILYFQSASPSVWTEIENQKLKSNWKCKHRTGSRRWRTNEMSKTERLLSLIHCFKEKQTQWKKENGKKNQLYICCMYCIHTLWKWNRRLLKNCDFKTKSNSTRDACLGDWLPLLHSFSLSHSVYLSLCDIL